MKPYYIIFIIGLSQLQGDTCFSLAASLFLFYGHDALLLYASFVQDIWHMESFFITESDLLEMTCIYWMENIT